MDRNLSSEFPNTVDESVEWLEDVLPEKGLNHIRGLEETDLDTLHFAIGTYVRNSLQIWDNEELKEDAGLEHPDDVSQLIIKRLWQKLQGDK